MHYGATTAGDGRFAPPRPPVSWLGVKDAYEYGSTSPQPGKVAGPMDEDCLALNVWTPSADAGRRPVMVWFHGGGFNSGSGSMRLFDGSRLAAENDVVVVTLNHRLGALGFLYLDEVSGGRVRTGNLGLLDLAAALRWVRGCISAFGGDPENVTIFGESGGGRKVATFSAMPAGSGLYQRMIIQSGPATRQLTAERANQYSEAFLKFLGVGPRLNSLRSIPLEKILAAQAAVDAPITMPVDNVMAGFAPVIDGVTLLRDAYSGSAPEISAGIPMMIGTCRWEQAAMYRTDPAVMGRKLTLADTEERLRPALGSDTGRIVVQYVRDYPELNPAEIFLLIDTERSYWLHSIRVAELRVARGKAPTYMFRLNWESQTPTGKLLKTPHGTDVPFVFDNTSVMPDLYDASDEVLDLAHRMSATWAAFARRGSPNNSLAPDWKPYTLPERATMMLDRQWKEVDDPGSTERRLLDAVELLS
jgi:para-nitrobenzyl esterase